MAHKLYIKKNNDYTSCKMENAVYKTTSPKPLLFSLDDDERMAIESYKARLVLQSAQSPEHEISADSDFHYEVYKKNSNSVYVRVPDPTSKINEIIPVYSTHISNNLRWSPSTAKKLEQSETDDAEQDTTIYYDEDGEEGYQQKNAVGSNIPGLYTGKYTFKDNIKTFADKSTMTPYLQDECCGGCSPCGLKAYIREYNGQVPTDDMAISFPQKDRDAISCRNSKHVDQMKCDKLTDYERLQRLTETSYNSNPVMKTCNVNNTNRIAGQLKYNQDSKETNGKKVPHISIMKRSDRSVSLERICNMKLSKCNIDKEQYRGSFPYAHRAHSKYHTNCRVPTTKEYQLEAGIQNYIEKRALRKKSPVSEIARERSHPIKYPKKLLTSIEI